jgi:hypothetical protein
MSSAAVPSIASSAQTVIGSIDGSSSQLLTPKRLGRRLLRGTKTPT